MLQTIRISKYKHTFILIRRIAIAMTYRLQVILLLRPTILLPQNPPRSFPETQALPLGLPPNLRLLLEGEALVVYSSVFSAFRQTKDRANRPDDHEF